ncbi:hypothetical protein GGS20DRAFT_361637 [Poronia punctata]|nr:hypothetical protein GGS20DRAFT_361637 [Poronia punctata]
MRSSKATIGSLDGLYSKVRQEKKTGAAKSSLAQKTSKSVVKAEHSSSDSDSSSSDSSSSDDEDVEAARAKYLEKKAGKTSSTKPVAATPSKPIPNGTPTSAQKPKDESDSTSSDSDSDSDSDSSDSKTSTDKKLTLKLLASHTKASAVKAESDTSSEGTSSSGSESEDESEDEKPSVPAKDKLVNGKASSDDESDTSSDEDMPSTGAQAVANGSQGKATANGVVAIVEESDSGSESDDEGDGGHVAIAKTNGSTTDSMSRAPWINGSDFTLRKASSSNPAKEVSEFLSSANLKGKQVWYFTAPASLPITVLKDMEIDLAKATEGGAVVKHDGDDYSMDLESHATTTQIQLLIPSSSGEKYTALNRGIDSTVHVRRMAKFGPGGDVHATATDEYVPIPRPIREQPQGLRPRYTPIGVPTPIPVPTTVTKKVSKVAKTDGDSDVDMATPPPPPPVSSSKAKSAKSSTTKKDRKRKQPVDEEAATPSVAKTSTPAEKPAKRIKAEKGIVKKETPVLPPSLSTIPSATPPTQSQAQTPQTGKAKKSRVKKENTPKPLATPSSTPSIPVKRTPIPLPTIPSMKR